MSEGRTISKKTAFFCSFILLSIPAPVLVRIYEPVHVKRIAWNDVNETALRAGDIFYSDLRADLALTGAINFLVFSSDFSIKRQDHDF